MSKRLLLFIIGVACLFLTPAPMAAQQSSDVLQRCQTEYDNGRLEEAEQLLKQHLGRFRGSQLMTAYRLLALSCLNQDRTLEAEQYVGEMLRIDPYYPSYNEGARFAEMIEHLKQGRQATVFTASQQAESVNEAPVPVTLITEEMIKASGARNLQELLICYVPGVTPIECEEMNITMRGTHADMQNLILVMLNGVRLNCYTTNSLSLDYRVTLANIQHIEVLRGAAASLYGDVALSAVVNIITKDGYQVDGLQLSAAAGNMHTLGGDFMFGKQLVDTDFLIWGSIYSSKGYKRQVPMDDPNFWGVIPTDKAYTFINGYNSPPAYDVGFTFHWKDLTVQLSHQLSKRTATHTFVFEPTYYDYDAYDAVKKLKPGRGMGQTLASVQYTHKWTNFTFDASITGRLETANMYDVLGDSLTWWQQHMVQAEVGTEITRGGFVVQNWEASAMTAETKGTIDYNLSPLGKGNLLVGLQLKGYQMYYGDQLVGKDFNDPNQMSLYTDIMSRIRESGWSCFAQVKHRFSNNIVFNGGLRYDFQHRFSGKNQHILSPRLSIMYNPSRYLNLRLSYAKSFVDAPYHWRATQELNDEHEELSPQLSHQLQFTLSREWPSVHLRYEGNVFYTNMKNIFSLNNEITVNAGESSIVGLENTLAYQYAGTMVQGNVYWQHVAKQWYPDYVIPNHNKLPSVTASVVASQQITKGLSVHGNVIFSGAQQYMGSIRLYRFDESYFDKMIDLPAYALLHLGASYQWKNVGLSVDCRNVLNTRYRLGGDFMPIYQEGRTVLAKLTVSFH